jgi:dethiobiotin synthetase/adenosylmethionine--8-amino-7-oxononanoate aminotransferase
MLDPASSKSYLNHEYLTPWFSEKGIPVCTPIPPPARASDQDQDRAAMESYYGSISDGPGEMQRAETILTESHNKRLQELESMPRRATSTFWWPFVQHDLIKDPKRDITTIDSAHGDTFSVHFEPDPDTDSTTSLLKPHLDGSASWWTQSFGHAHPRLALAAAHAAGRYGHVLFPLAVHAPALDLAERLVKGPGAGWADRVFYSDDGSTAVEVALKMAVRAVALRHRQNGTPKPELGVLGIKGSYHGDTIGAMDACEGGVYNASVEWHRERGFWFDPPTVGVHDGTVRVTVPPSLGGSGAQQITFPSISAVYDIPSRLQTSLADTYRKSVRSEFERLTSQGQAFGALMIEPIVLGAGGMLFIDPLFQHILVDTTRSSSDLFKTDQSTGWTGLPVIFDEVFTGFHRLGPLTSASMLGTTPDIAVYAKILTGGVVPLSATLSTNAIFSAFNFPSAKKIDALLHGHSYSAHPVGCAVASASMDEMKFVTEGMGWEKAKNRCAGELYAWDERTGNAWTLWDPDFVKAVSRSELVEQAMALGTVFAMTLRGSEGGESAHMMHWSN